MTRVSQGCSDATRMPSLVLQRHVHTDAAAIQE
jgi:hypothetical protein